MARKGWKKNAQQEADAMLAAAESTKEFKQSEADKKKKKAEWKPVADAMDTETEGHAMYDKNDELDGDNTKAMLSMNRVAFKKFVETFKKTLEKANPPTLDFWTYPGDKAGGAVDAKGEMGCTRHMCHLNPKEWKNNFAYVSAPLIWHKTLGGGAAPAKEYKLEEKMSDAEMGNPFYFSSYCDWTTNPMPAGMLNLWFVLAIITNIAQNWMSALLSKTMSSLWKNIFAAVALALIVLVQAAIMDPADKNASRDWVRMVIGTSGVLLTSMIFSQAPKEKK